MDIYQRLTQDHNKQRELAQSIVATQGESDERRRLWNQFQSEAVAHANAEEQVFYKCLIGNADTQEQARHSVNEHHEADKLIEELNDLDMGSGGWIQKFEKLKDELEHHMDEEENEVFTKAEKVIDQDEAERLGDEFDTRKQREREEA